MLGYLQQIVARTAIAKLTATLTRRRDNLGLEVKPIDHVSLLGINIYRADLADGETVQVATYGASPSVPTSFTSNGLEPFWAI